MNITSLYSPIMNVFLDFWEKNMIVDENEIELNGILGRREGLTKKGNLKEDSTVQTIDVERNGKRQETFPGYLKSSGFSRGALGSRLQPVFTMCKAHHRKSLSCTDKQIWLCQSQETILVFSSYLSLC